ncbi:hypothetical protein HMPREF9996_01510 [Aggregatibacter actinomycetemcomitans Y4]|nr:hypothetical protein HMPREF9996_01510 [Aggregatibacter actinomycetemcomitans Y4]
MPTEITQMTDTCNRILKILLVDKKASDVKDIPKIMKNKTNPMPNLEIIFFNENIVSSLF